MAETLIFGRNSPKPNIRSDTSLNDLMSTLLDNINKDSKVEITQKKSARFLIDNRNLSV